MAPSPITSITVKTGSAVLLFLDLLDQTGEPISGNIDWLISDSTVVTVYKETTTDVNVKGLKPGSCTITFSFGGASKVLTVTVVDPIPTTINVIPHTV